MARADWTAVDDYFGELWLESDPVLTAALAASEAAGLPAINVSPLQGKMLMLLAQIQGARRILEIGTLGGYSTIWLARALPEGGNIVTLEYQPKHAEVARANFARAGLSDRIDLRVGRALDTLPKLADENSGPFDLVFIDADKPNNPNYFDWALKLTRPGSVIILDNIVRDGAVVETDGSDPNVEGVRRFAERVARDKRVAATAVQTVGSKGYDGFALLRVIE